MNLEILRSICLSFPGATEDVKWEKNLVFSVGEKMFCSGALVDEFGISFKVDRDEFDEISSSHDIMPAPYLARAQWIKILKPERFTKQEWEDRLRRSYELVRAGLTKKVRESLSGQ